MEIAFHTLIVLVFIIFPGAVLRRFFYRGEFTKQFDSQSWYHTLFYSAVFSILVHFVTAILFHETIFEFDKDHIIDFFRLFSGGELDPGIVYKYGFKELKLLALYFFLVLSVGAGLGSLFFWLVRGFGLDLHSFLRFNNHWHYYFKGEITKTGDFQNIKKEGRVIRVYADILAKTSESNNTLYSGVLNQHTIDKKTGQLENVYLTKVSRFKSGFDANYEPFRRDVPGDIFILPKDRIVNMNLTFLTEVRPPVKYEPFSNAILIVGYFIIWADVFTKFRTLPLEYKIYAKVMLHLDLWLFVALSFAVIYKSRNKINDKDIWAYFFGLVIFLILSILLYVSHKEIFDLHVFSL